MREAVGSDARGVTPEVGRRGALDFWRGVILCTIFVNHVPGTVFERLTYRNFGFSDSAEAFVFLSGVSLALAYRRRLALGQMGSVILALQQRVVRLYGAHVALSLAGLAIFAAGAAGFGQPDLMQPHGRDLAVEDPVAALIGVVSLGHQLGYFNILPLYLVLVAAVPALLWLARFGRGWMLGVSAAVYALARLFAVNIPTWPLRGVWFLDPFTWQLLLAIGLAVGLGLTGPQRPPSRLLLALSAAILVACLVCCTNALGGMPGLFDRARQTLDLDKTMLGLGRLVHFLALAYLIAGLGLTGLLQRTRCFPAFSLLGRHSLTIFAALSLLAALGQVLTQGLGHSLPLDAVVVGGGLAVLFAMALLLEAPWRPQLRLAGSPHRLHR